jgi:hypothetical protein
MSQLRVNTVATSAGVTNLTTNSLGVSPTSTITLHATRTGNGGAINEGTYIRWNTQIVSSPYYNAGTGLFTAPIAGKYFVSAHVIISGNNGYIDIYKNGVIQSFSHINVSATWAHLTVTGIVQCAVNDTIGVGTRTFSYYGDNHNGYTLYYLGA